MTTMAIGFILLSSSSFLFLIQNEVVTEKSDKQIIQEEIPEIQIETKTEIKIQNPVIVEEIIKVQEEFKKIEKKVYKPKYPDFEVFEQLEDPKEGKYTKNFNRFTKEFQTVKIRADGIVPITNEKFNLDNPQTFSAMSGYIPGIFSIALLQTNMNEHEVISTLESISGVEIAKAKKGTYSYTIIFNVSNLTQGEIYELEKNIKINTQIDYIEKKIITLPEYNTRENKQVREKYESDMDNL